MTPRRARALGHIVAARAMLVQVEKMLESDADLEDARIRIARARDLLLNASQELASEAAS